MMKLLRLPALAAMLAAGMAGVARADSLLNVSGKAGPEPETTVRQFRFDVAEPKARLVIDTSATLSKGTATFRVLGPDGKELFRRGGGRFTASGGWAPGTKGRLRFEVSTQAAVGTWTARIFEPPKPSALRPFLISGPAMILVALGSVVYWKRRSRTPLRWFWVGAGIWSAGVALKFAWSVLLRADSPILHGLESILPRAGYIAAGGVYVGLLTGVFEIGITLAAARVWRSMARDPNRAVAVGVGAGAFEALLLGLGGFVALLLAFLGAPGTEPVLLSVGRDALVTPLLWLAGPVERLIAILCHTSSRTLVLFSVATRRWSFFWGAFALMTGLDAIAGVAHISGAIGHISMWWIELAIAPFALASVPIIRWCLRHWPDADAPAAEQPSEAESPDGGT